MPSDAAIPSEKQTPCLFDLLIDEDVKNKEIEGRTRRVIKFEEYKKAVLRDLGWLLNSTAHIIEEEFSDFPGVASSVLNFGMASLSGMAAAGLNLDDVAQAIAGAVRNFEPRIIGDTLEVVVDDDSEGESTSTIAFNIRGELWDRPYPEPLFIKTEFDLGTGSVSVTKM